MIDDGQIAEYRVLARKISRRFFATELAFDRDDMEQEAMIAVWDALQRYSTENETTRKYFVALVVRRHLVSVVRAAKAQHRQGNSAALRLVDPEEGAVTDLIPTRDLGPQGQVELRTELRRLEGIIEDRLSPAERDAVLGRIAGQKITSKRIDNARQRAKKKLSAPGGSNVCPECAHSWERHGPKWAHWITAPGTCSVRGCKCATAMAVAA